MNTKNFSFSKRSAAEQLTIAKKLWIQFKSDSCNEALADQLAEEIWKCTDYFHREGICSCDKNDLKKCQESMREQCKSLGAINDVCDSSKHSGIDRKKCTLEKSELYDQGSFSNAFSPSFDTSGLVVKYPDNDGHKFFVSEAGAAIEFLEQFVGA